MVIMHPLFDDHGFIIHCNEVVFATQVPTPEMSLSRFPDYAIITTEEEAVSDMLTEGLATAKIFGVRYSLARIRPGHPHPQVLLLSFLVLRPGDEVRDPDDVVLLLREECPIHRQQQLARILQYLSLGVDIVIQAVYEWLYPENPDNEEDR